MIVSKYITIKGKSYVEAMDYDKILLELKDSNNRIAELEDKINTLRARCRKSAIDAFNNGNYGFLYIVTADELKDDELPTNPMEAAQMLIDAKYVRKTNAIDRFCGYEGDTMEVDKYSINDLEQIAEHLLVYCKHNKESEQ